MFCENCGTQAASSARFCGACGANLGARPFPASPAGPSAATPRKTASRGRHAIAWGAAGLAGALLLLWAFAGLSIDPASDPAQGSNQAPSSPPAESEWETLRGSGRGFTEVEPQGEFLDNFTLEASGRLQFAYNSMSGAGGNPKMTIRLMGPGGSQVAFFDAENERFASKEMNVVSGAYQVQVACLQEQSYCYVGYTISVKYVS